MRIRGSICVRANYRRLGLRTGSAWSNPALSVMLNLPRVQFRPFNYSSQPSSHSSPFGLGFLCDVLTLHTPLSLESTTMSPKRPANQVYLSHNLGFTFTRPVLLLLYEQIVFISTVLRNTSFHSSIVRIALLRSLCDPRIVIRCIERQNREDMYNSEETTITTRLKLSQRWRMDEAGNANTREYWGKANVDDERAGRTVKQY